MSTQGTGIPITFKIYKEGALLKEMTLAQDVIKIGQLWSTHLTLADPSVAKTHAYVQISGPGEIYICDLGSAAGTLVNGHRVNKSRLQTGDRVRLGDIELVVALGKAPVAEEPAAAPRRALPQKQPAPTTPPAAPAKVARPSRAELAQLAQPVAEEDEGLPTERRSHFSRNALTSADLAETERQDGVQTIEVVASYRGVPRIWRHLPDPRSGRPRLTTLLLLVLGIGLAAAGFGLMVQANLDIRRQIRHQAGVAEFIKEYGLSDKFVPKVKPNELVDNLSYSLAFLGMFGLILGGIRLREDLQSPDFTIGEDPASSFHTPAGALPPRAPRFPLVRSDRRQYQVLFTSRMDGWMDVGERRLTLEELAKTGQARPSPGLEDTYEYPLAAGACGEVQIDAETVFGIRSVPAGKPLAPPPVPTRALALLSEPTFMSTAGTTLLTALVFVLYLATPKGAHTLESSPMEGKGRIQRITREEIQVQRKKEPKPEPEPVPVKPKPTDPKTPTEAMSPTSGSTSSQPTTANPNPGGAPNPGGNPNAGGDNKPQGMLQVLSRLAPAFTMLTPGAALDASAEDALAALQPNMIGDTGPGWLPGGPGDSRGPGKPGFVGPPGYPPGFPGMPGFPPGNPFPGLRIPGYRPTAPKELGKVDGRVEKVEGGLDGDTIQRVIRRHLDEIKYCYNSIGLPTNPKLRGQVKVFFSITIQGTVKDAQIQSTSLGHPGTEACILSAVRRWRFPRPEGSMPLVVYPFNFAPTGG
jgi:TonB family protein